jgi:hypothetical protein
MKKSLLLLSTAWAVACSSPQHDPETARVIQILDSTATRVAALKDTIDLTQFPAALQWQPQMQGLLDSLVKLPRDTNDRAFWVDRLGRLARCERAFRKGGTKEADYRSGQASVLEQLTALHTGLNAGDFTLDSISDIGGRVLFAARQLELGIRGTYQEVNYCVGVADTAVPSARSLLKNP